MDTDWSSYIRRYRNVHMNWTSGGGWCIQVYILRMFENMRDYMANGRRYNRIYVDGRY